MFNEYPYVNLQDVNLDWILKHIKDLENNLQDFVKLNTIKYADPIIWNITTQYETNTVVIDGNTGTAYLSVAPVPAGVALTNTDYWTVIFTLNLTTSNQNITFRDDGTNVIATFASDTGDWLLWNFYLYRVTQPIAVNTAYVVGFNLERFSVELFIRDYINALAAIVGDLDNLTTSDKTSIVNAINSLVSVIGDLDNLTTDDKTSIVNAINSLVSVIGDLDNLTTDDKTSIVNAINENVGKIALLNEVIVTPQMFGAAADGVTNDVQAIRDAVTELNGRGGGLLYFPAGNYLVKPLEVITDVNSPYYYGCVNIPDNITVYGNGAKLTGDSTVVDGVYDPVNRNKSLLYITGDNVKVSSLNIDKGYCGIVTMLNKNIVLEDLNISNTALDGIYVGNPGSTGTDVEQLTVKNCNITKAHRNGISFLRCKNAVVDNNIITNVDTATIGPGCGIDLEPEVNAVISDVVISNNVFTGNVYGVQLYGDLAGDVQNVKVINNIVKDNTTKDIYAEFINDCTFENNEVSNTSVVNNFHLYKAVHCRLIGNDIVGNILMTTNNTMITNNHIKNSQVFGVRLEYLAGYDNDNNAIIGNIIENPQTHGIWVNNGDFLTIRDNKIIDANAGNNANFDGCGITCYVATDSVISGNQIVNINHTVNAPIYIPDSNTVYTIIKNNIQKGSSNAFILWGAASCVTADNLNDV